ncbi:MAG: methionine--tRNA ligase subunit beta [Candidatus Micrarchaeota archaeon]
MTEITYEDFTKLDLRVGKILEVERVEGTTRLLKLLVSLGDEERTLCAGIADYYALDELLGKQVIVIANLAPRKIKGIESNGMLLAASTEDDSQVVLLTPEKEIKEGSKIS